MSRQDLNNFIHTLKHSSELRREIRKCNDDKSLLSIASSYGFALTLEDLKDDEISEKVSNWFNRSKISPIKKD